MSKLTRALVLGATLAAMNLAAMITVAQAQTNDEPTSNQDTRQPPTEGQVGEAWRHPPSGSRAAHRRGRHPAAPVRSPSRRGLAPPDQRPGAAG